jgi:tight adherence protein C
VGVLFVVRGLFPPRPPLPVALARLSRTAPTVASGSVPAGWLSARVGATVAEALGALGVDFGSRRRDLAVTGRSLEAHVGAKVGVGAFGALLAPATAAVMAVGGVVLPAVVVFWAAVAGGAAGFAAPDLVLRGEAAERRAEFRQALSPFLDLAVIVLAGGGGIQTALERAAGAGDGWPQRRLRQALDDARTARSTPWAAMGRLGEELGVDELQELAASVALAGTEGARVRESLVAKAASLRAHELASAEADASQATEAMSVPVALLALGFIAFLAFPAVMAVLSVS